MESTLAALERRKIELKQQFQAEKQRHSTAIDNLTSEYRIAEERAQIIISGMDEAKILLAEHAMYVSGSYANAGQDKAVQREQAIQWLLEGGEKLRHDYLGTKNYDRWHGQGIECSYGMCPRHGSVIFSIGMTKAARSREAAPPLTEQEIDACVYYLRNLERIQEAKAITKAAATGAA